MINMRRQPLLSIADCHHAGLLLDRGFEQWEDSGDAHNGAILQLHKKAADITQAAAKNGSLYQEAYARWKNITLKENADNWWIGKTDTRLFIGMGNASPLEAGVSLHHTYGVPVIPGSAIKGLLNHYTLACGLSNDVDARAILFGKKASDTDKRDSGAAGYLIFNDAWWVPDGKALAPEIITTHATNYYKDKGKDAIHPDFEDPNPNPQIAVQGSFLFSVEGDKKWAEFAMELLQQALQEWGIGGKTAAGYGYFNEDLQATTKLHQEIETEKSKRKVEQKEALILSEKSPFEQELYTLQKKMTNKPKELLDLLEKGHWKKLREQQTVAEEIQKIMQEKKQWKPNYGGGNNKDKKFKDRSLKVNKYLEESQ